MWPREHGAYAQLALPLVAALALATPTLASAAIALAAVGAFLAHEPALILLGRRGERRLTEQFAPARLRLVACLGTALFAGLYGFAAADAATRIACGGVLAAAAIAGVSIYLQMEKTLVGECYVAATLVAASLPVALASGVPLLVAAKSALVFWVTFLLEVLTVHGVVASTKQGSRTLLIAASGFAVLVLACAGVAAFGAAYWALAVLPPALVPMLALASGTTTRHLRQLGWGMAAASTATLIILLVAIHALP